VRWRVSSRNPFQASRGRLEPIVFCSVVYGARVLVESSVVGDRFIKPIVQAHAGAAGGLHRGVAGPSLHTRDIPRHGSIHVLDHRSGPRIAG
jgi:hypothetical protein